MEDKFTNLGYTTEYSLAATTLDAHPELIFMPMDVIVVLTPPTL